VVNDLCDTSGILNGEFLADLLGLVPVYDHLPQLHSFQFMLLIGAVILIVILQSVYQWKNLDKKLSYYLETGRQQCISL